MPLKTSLTTQSCCPMDRVLTLHHPGVIGPTIHFDRFASFIANSPTKWRDKVNLQESFLTPTRRQAAGRKVPGRDTGRTRCTEGPSQNKKKAAQSRGLNAKYLLRFVRPHQQQSILLLDRIRSRWAPARRRRRWLRMGCLAEGTKFSTVGYSARWADLARAGDAARYRGNAF